MSYLAKGGLQEVLAPFDGISSSGEADMQLHSRCTARALSGSCSTMTPRRLSSGQSSLAAMQDEDDEGGQQEVDDDDDAASSWSSTSSHCRRLRRRCVSSSDDDDECREQAVRSPRRHGDAAWSPATCSSSGLSAHRPPGSPFGNAYYKRRSMADIALADRMTPEEKKRTGMGLPWQRQPGLCTVDIAARDVDEAALNLCLLPTPELIRRRSGSASPHPAAAGSSSPAPQPSPMTLQRRFTDSVLAAAGHGGLERTAPQEDHSSNAASWRSRGGEDLAMQLEQPPPLPGLGRFSLPGTVAPAHSMRRALATDIPRRSQASTRDGALVEYKLFEPLERRVSEVDAGTALLKPTYSAAPPLRSSNALALDRRRTLHSAAARASTPERREDHASGRCSSASSRQLSRTPYR
eukprot:TRINITY_DN19298_c0_g1_i1.p1 TRINITY_DN19298_c0_g1~~TRINITY_DN19298_c0_g1_i1.p1  ORF type:complete len:408 (+),score=87.65 TRINITY_DN19298_c0_g1_i1:83-1306(+)